MTLRQRITFYEQQINIYFNRFQFDRFKIDFIEFYLKINNLKNNINKLITINRIMIYENDILNEYL